MQETPIPIVSWLPALLQGSPADTTQLSFDSRLEHINAAFYTKVKHGVAPAWSQREAHEVSSGQFHNDFTGARPLAVYLSLILLTVHRKLHQLWLKNAEHRAQYTLYTLTACAGTCQHAACRNASGMLKTESSPR